MGKFANARTYEQFGRQCDAMLDPPDEDDPLTDEQREAIRLDIEDRAQDAANEWRGYRPMRVVLFDEMRRK